MSNLDVSCAASLKEDGQRTDADRLRLPGWWVEHFNCYEDFVKRLERIGSTIDVTDVEVRPGLRVKLHSANAMPLHTDDPSVDLVAWFCVRQSDEDGESLLLDVRESLRRLSQEQRALLRNVRIRVPSLDGNVFHPMLSDSRAYYAAWLLEQQGDPVVQETLASFQEHMALEPRTRVRLQAGDALIVNNRWVLHGREKIREIRTRRLLIRHWVRVDRPSLMDSGLSD